MVSPVGRQTCDDKKSILTDQYPGFHYISHQSHVDINLLDT